MTSNDLSSYKNKFLDNFPLTVTEVERLMALFEILDQDKNHENSSLSALSRQTQSRVRSRGSSNQEEAEEEQWLSSLQQAQEGILPHASRWLLIEAPKHVCPLLPYDIPDDKSLSICRAFYFFEAIVSLLGRRGTRFLMEFVFDVASTMANGEGPTAEGLVDVLYRHLMAALYMQERANRRILSVLLVNTNDKKQHLQPPKAWIQSLRTSTSQPAMKRVTRPAWTAWIEKIPEAMRGLSTFYHRALFPPGHPAAGPNSLPTMALPKPDQETSFWNYTDSCSLLPLSLACMSSSLCGNWYRLYSSDCDGLSFLSFQRALLSYAGPTVILVRPKDTAGACNNGGIFGFYTECPWKESSSWFGGDGFDSFLFKFDESDLGIYWPTWESANGHYMYMNTAPEHGMHNHHHHAVPIRGLAIGGISSDTPRVHLTPSLENCKAASTDTAYASGTLLPDNADGMASSPFFHVEALEVWAVNVSKEKYLQHLAAGQKQLAHKEKVRLRSAQVDRSQFLDDLKSGAFINHLFLHREEARGRHDFVAADSRSGYFLEDKPPSQSVISPSGSERDDEAETRLL